MKILYLKDKIETFFDAPIEWVGTLFDPNKVREHLISLNVVQPQDYLTIHIWRTNEDRDFHLKADEKIFCCYNLKNYYINS